MKRVLLLSCLFAALSATAQSYRQPVKTAAEGWFNLTQLSFITGEGNEDAPARSNMVPSVVTINGYRYNEHFSLGFGVGMTSYSYSVFPVFADLRFTLLKGNLSPVLALRGGYAFAGSSKEIFRDYYGSGDYKNTGGGMFNPEFGFKITMTEQADFLLTIGYYYQHLQTEVRYEPGSYAVRHNRVTDINRLSFSIGFLFK